MSYTYQAGFIGAGNMGGALALAAAKTAGGEQIAVSCSTADSTAAAAERLGCAAETPARILRGSRFVFLGMKPQLLDYVMAPLAADVAGSDAIFVSMLAGVRIERLQKLLGAEKKIIRIMPNTPCAVGEGMILLCRGAGVTDGEVAEFRALMAHSTRSPRRRSTRRAPSPGAARRLRISLSRRWPTAASPAVCRARRRSATPRRCCSGAPPWCCRAASTPAC